MYAFTTKAIEVINIYIFSLLWKCFGFYKIVFLLDTIIET